MKKVLNYIGIGYIYLTLVLVLSALTFDLFFIYLHFSDQDKLAHDISNEIMWRIDGTFKDDPRNIWYKEK